MNTVSTEPRLALVVANPEALQQGTAPRYSFDPAGGTIGSQGASWLLHDRVGRVKPQHCEIRFEDGGYLVIDRSGYTRLNEQTRSLGLHASARLRDADTLHVGPYRLTVHLDEEQHALPDPSRVLAQHGVEELMRLPNDYLDTLPTEASEGQHSVTSNPDCAAFQALSEPPRPQGQLDPLHALDLVAQRSAGGAEGVSLDLHHYGLSPLAAQVDLAATAQEAVYGKPIHASGDTIMSEPDSHNPAAREWLHAQQANGHDPAGVVNPLVEGLGAPVGALDAQTAYALLYEAGRSLSATISGLSALHGGAPGQRQRTLQPIEDNPCVWGKATRTPYALCSPPIVASFTCRPRQRSRNRWSRSCASSEPPIRPSPPVSAHCCKPSLRSNCNGDSPVTDRRKAARGTATVGPGKCMGTTTTS
ncbi:hypothetical protein C7S15_2474 [Burkholderia cepacia]|nr:hypothetical protein [Burkholderia cepacia]MDW9227898.1 hypothetical protein [Burkholderia cepacia]